MEGEAGARSVPEPDSQPEQKLRGQNPVYEGVTTAILRALVSEW